MQLMSKCENFPYLNKVRQVLQFYFMQATWNLGRKKKKIDVLWKLLLDKDFGSNFEGNQSFFSETYNFSQIQIKTHFFKNPHKIVLSQ